MTKIPEKWSNFVKFPVTPPMSIPSRSTKSSEFLCQVVAPKKKKIPNNSPSILSHRIVLETHENITRVRCIKKPWRTRVDFPRTRISLHRRHYVHILRVLRTHTVINKKKGITIPYQPTTRTTNSLSCFNRRGHFVYTAYIVAPWNRKDSSLFSFYI